MLKNTQGLKDSLSYKLEHIIKKIMGKQKYPSPFLFFLLYAYKHSYEQSNYENDLLIFGLLIVLCFGFSYNIFYFFTPFFGNLPTTILSFFFGLSSANQKWKLYLFVFVVGNSLNIQYDQQIQFFTVVAALYLSVQTYQNLIFPTIQDCKMYFCGFFTISLFQTTTFVLNYLQKSQFIAYLMIPFSAAFAFYLLNIRLQTLNSVSLTQFKNSHIFYHRIKLEQIQLSKKQLRDSKLQMHKEICQNLLCFCRKQHNKSDQLKQQKANIMKLTQIYMIRSMYQVGLKMQLHDQQILQKQYILFLLKNGELSEAIYRFSKMCAQNSFSYFQMVQKCKIKCAIQEKIKVFDYFHMYTKQFVYVFDYDISYLKLACQIKQILKLKKQFWIEVAKDFSLMVKIQTIGSQIVERMYKLNNQYHQQIKNIQEKVKNYNGTILYAMYLLSTTNYKQFAESLIKNTSRNLQSIKINQDNNVQLYGLKISIKDSLVSFNQKIYGENIFKKSLFGIQCENLQQFSKQLDQQLVNLDNRQAIHQIDEVITNISGSFCKLLNSSKAQMLNSNISLIIPVLYRTKHHEKIKKIINLDFGEDQFKKLTFLNQVRQIQFRTMNKRLISGKVSIEIHNQINGDLSFMSTISIFQSNKATVITDINGKIHQAEEGLTNLGLVKSPQVKSCIQQLKKQWRKQKVITSLKKLLTFQNNHYTLLFSSPYQDSFLTNQQQPPIHIDIITQSLSHKENKIVVKTQEVNKCIQKIQKSLCKDDNSSQTSSGTRKSSVIGALSSFSQGYFIPFYLYIVGLFSILLFISLITIFVGLSNLDLQWDNTVPLKNPICNLLDASKLNLYLIRAISHSYDNLQYNQNSLLNKTKIDGYYGQNYNQYYLEEINRIQKQYNKSITLFTMYQSSIYASYFDNIMKQLIPVVNPYQTDPQLQVQFLTIQHVFLSFAVDLYQISIGQNFFKKLLSFSFWGFFTSLSASSAFSPIVEQQIAKSSKNIIIFMVVICIFMSLSVIPLIIILRKRAKKHIDIYDLIVSIQGQMICQEVKKLQNIIEIVVRANEASQVLKTNIQTYQARKRSSIIIKNSGEGQNQLVEGLIAKKQSNYSQFQEQNIQKQMSFKNDGTGHSQINKSKFSFTQKNQQKIKQQTNQQHLYYRKRGGELNLQMSDGHPQKIVIINWILYLLLLSTLFFLVSIGYQKITNFNNIDDYVKRMGTIVEHKYNQSKLLLNQKLYYRGTKSPDANYDRTTLISWLNKHVYSNQVLLVTDSVQQSSSQFSDCQNLNNFTFCQQKYSLQSLRYEISQIIKDSFQQKLKINLQLNLTAQNYTQVSPDLTNSFSEVFFYTQSMDDRVYNLTLNSAEQLIESMINESEILSNKVSNYLICSIIWGFLSLLIGFYVVNLMKKSYLKQIMIVSFLNSQMIAKNKRVQSFIQTLAKFSY